MSSPVSQGPPRPPQARSHGFTLVEVLVSAAILSMLMLLLSQIFSQASHSWTEGHGGAERRRSTRAVADYIGNELRQALLPVEGVSTGGGGNLQFFINPPTSRLPGTYRNADAIFWQAPLASETSLGDIAVLGYFVKWEGSTPHLCRLFINPSINAGNGTVVKNPDYRIYDDTDANSWLSDQLVAKLVRPTDKDAGYKGSFASNVLGLWICAYGLDGKMLPREFDSREGYDCEFATPAGTLVTQKRFLPAMVRVSLAQVDNRRATHIAAAEPFLRGLLARADIRDASAFMEALQGVAQSNPAVRALLPGTRIYSKEVHLQNSK